MSLVISASIEPLNIIGFSLVGLALLLNLILNTFNFHLFKKNVWEDEKFKKQFKSLTSKQELLGFYAIIAISLLLSHKFIEILFSNIFKAKFFIFKVKSVLKLQPFNYLKYSSVFVSLVGVGAGIILMNVGDGNMFWLSLDTIILSSSSIFASVAVTFRKR